MAILISAVIITYNEQKHIGKCIQSLLLVADEIVVIDSFSTDNTKDICIKLGAKFITNPFQGYIEQKNYAITQASYPYILSLDADEELSPELQQAIIKVKNNCEFDAYYVNRLNNFCGQWIKHSGWYPDRKIRLWKKEVGSWKGINPHDKLELISGAKVGYLQANLLHFTIQSIQQHVAQINHFSEIKAKSLYSRQKKTSFLKVLFKPLVKFAVCYILKLGFLDGFYGLIIAINSGYAEFLIYTKLYELQKNT